MSNQITSYICSVSIGLDPGFLQKLMKDLDFNPDDDFEYDQGMGTVFFQHIRDFVTGFDFINRNGHFTPLGAGFYTGWGSAIVLFKSIRIKEKALKAKHPNQLSIFYDNNYFITVGLKFQQIEFFHFDYNHADKNTEYHGVKRIGSFPYFDFIQDILKLHETTHNQDDKRNEITQIEKETFNQQKYNGWKLLNRTEFSILDIKDYSYPDERPLEDFHFESDFATVKLSFQPETGEIDLTSYRS